LVDDSTIPELTAYDTYFMNAPVCPYCGHEDQYWGESCPRNTSDGTTYVDSCPNCDKEYEVLVYVDYSFTTSKVELDKSDESE
jgi:hypothetical protein